MHGGTRTVEPLGGTIGIQTSSVAKRISSESGSAGAGPHQLLHDTPIWSCVPDTTAVAAVAGEAPLTSTAPLASVIWAVCYFGLTLGGPNSASIGMRIMDIEMRTWYGAPAYFVLGAVHAIAFWFTVSFFTPLVLLVCFFNQRRRLLHDIILGTVVVNNPVRVQSLRAMGLRS